MKNDILKKTGQLRNVRVEYGFGAVCHCCPLLSIVAHCCPLLSIVVHCCQLLSIVFHCYPLFNNVMIAQLSEQNVFELIRKVTCRTQQH